MPTERKTPMKHIHRTSHGRGAAVAVVGAATLLLAACSSSTTSTESSAAAPSDNGAASTATSDSTGGAAEGTSITFVAGVKGDPFYITMSCGAQEAAAAAGATFEFQAPNSFSPTDQVPIVDGVAAARPSALLIAPTDSASMYAPIQRVSDEGTKIVLVDTTLDNPDIAASSVKTDDYQGGVEAAKKLSELVGGSGEVLLLNFQPGVSTTEARGKGFVDTAESVGLTVVGTEYSGTEIEKGTQIVDATLQRYPDLAGVFTTTDYGAQGTVTSLRNAGKLGQVKVVGFDASPVMVEQLKAGDIQAIVSQQARTIGKLGVEQALKAVAGEPTEASIEVPTITITKVDLESADVAAGLQVDTCS